MGDCAWGARKDKGSAECAAVPSHGGSGVADEMREHRIQGRGHGEHHFAAVDHHKMQGPIHETRRRYNRVPMQTEVMCRVGSETLKGTTWNLSQGGMEVEVDNLEREQRVQLWFRLPEHPIRIEASGVVAWMADTRQGIHFTDMSLEYQEIVRDFVAQAMLLPK